MKFKITIFVIALALFAMLVSACGTTTPFKSDALDGTSWELVAISKHPPIEESQISILFEGGQASGSSGCNRYGGGDKINIGGGDRNNINLNIDRSKDINNIRNKWTNIDRDRRPCRAMWPTHTRSRHCWPGSCGSGPSAWSGRRY